MEIVKLGNILYPIETKKFECKACGCIFKANRNEYRCPEFDDDPPYYKCACPTCGYIVYLRKE